MRLSRHLKTQPEGQIGRGQSPEILSTVIFAQLLLEALLGFGSLPFKGSPVQPRTGQVPDLRG